MMKKSHKLPRSLPSKRPVRAGFPAHGVKTTLAFSLGSAMMMSMTAQAADEAINLDKLTVEERTIDTNPYAEPGAPYKAKKSGDERYKRDLADIPQNISILTKTQIEDSGYTDLREILDAQPGVTLGTGENGNAFGDRYIIRGQEARSDVFVDGLRDPGMTIRESFATEQVEISKGPNSSFAGRGTSGGAVNSVTKQASTEYDFTKLSAGVGTDNHTRLTLDANKTLSDTAALRVNALYGYEGVPDRDPTDRERKGLALSGIFQPSDRLEVVLDYYGMRADDNPDLGGFLTGTAPNRVPYANPPVYAQEEDFIESDVDTLTARLKFKIAPDLRITNSTRYGTSDNGYVATGARMSTVYASAADAIGGEASDTVGTNPYDAITLSTHNGWQEVEYLANQTNLHWDTLLGGKKHEFIFGLEYTDHKVLNGIYDVDNNGATNCYTRRNANLTNDSGTDDTASSSTATCITDVAGDPINGINTVLDRQIAKDRWDQDWQAKTTALSAMDTVELNDKWTAFAGLRWDHYDIDLTTQNSDLEQTKYGYSDSVWNGHLGLTWKFRPDANVYATYSTASEVNGGESDVGTSAGYGGMISDDGKVASKPEVSRNIELGTKWNLFGGKLLSTASVFQITKSDVMEGADYGSAGTFNTGKNRVRGIEFGLAGNITDKLSAQGGVAFMESEVLESYTAANVGKTLSNFADTTASLQLRYQATPKFAFGAAAKYESEKYAGQPDTAASFSSDTGLYSQPIPAYTVVDVFANYRVNKQTDLRLNVGNVADKDYYLAGYRSGSFLYKGDARNVRLTLNYDF